MTTIKVTNFRAIKSADVDVSGISIIAADNEGGKTSFIHACRSVLTAQTIPIDGITAKKAALFVHSGTAGSEIVCQTEAGESKITFPDLTKTSSGTPMEISGYAAGLESIVDTPLKDRSKIIADLLKTSPTIEELKKELASAGVVEEKTVTSIVQTVAAQGYDASHAHAKETGIKNKALWENETGENYGSKKAAEWLPAAWTPELATARREDIEGLVKQEQEWLEMAISDEAVDASEIASLQSAADKLPDLTQKVSGLEDMLSKLFEEKERLIIALKKLPFPNKTTTWKCPYCKGELEISDGKIIVPVTLTEAEVKQRSEDIAEHKGLIKTMSDRIGDVSQQLQTARVDKQQAIIAEKKLQDRKPSGGSSKKSVDECRIRVLAAQGKLTAFYKKNNASKYAKLIEDNQKIIEILAPDGLRLRILKNKLSAFNSQLKQITDVAGWAPVEIKENMHVTYRGTPYMLISGAAQFKTRVVLQVAAARIDGSRLILIDSADILASGQNRNGLFKMLIAVGIPTVVAMAFGDAKKVPVGKGINSYWIENGIAKKL